MVQISIAKILKSKVEKKNSGKLREFRFMFLTQGNSEIFDFF